MKAVGVTAAVSDALAATVVSCVSPAPSLSSVEREVVKLAAEDVVTGERFLSSRVLDDVSEDAAAVVVICIVAVCLPSTDPEALRLPALVP